MLQVRAPAVSGLFYTDQPRQLTESIHTYLQDWPSLGDRPKALIVPHAGYQYSGTVAAAAYQRLVAWAEQIRQVVLLGPSHRIPLRGMAIPSTEYFQTPLGDVTLAQPRMQRLASRFPQVQVNDLAHQFEHSLEVQLPFLQEVLGDFELIPIVVGYATAQAVAEVVEELWGGPETLFVISSDLSHYHTYSEAQCIDQDTAHHIDALQGDLEGEQACGCYAVNGWLLAARQHGLHPQQLALMNSGDTSGDRSRVVGYGAWAFV